MLPFVGIALRVQEKLEIIDKNGKAMTMRFAKIYSPEKMGRIVGKAQSYSWWRNNTTAAFMKAIGEINKDEKIKKEELLKKPAQN